MKRLQFIFLFVLSTVLFTACKKDKNDPEVSSGEVAATYEGKFGTGNNSPSSFFSFNVKPDGVLEELNSSGSVKGKGIWTISGNTFQGTTHDLFPVTNFYSYRATYDAATKKLTGTWGYGNNETDGGQWHMTKK